MVSSDEKPRPPAVAYSIVAALLAPSYFTTPPPAEGVCLRVTGSDNVETYWEMDPMTATTVEQRLRGRRDLTVKRAIYSSRSGLGGGL